MSEKLILADDSTNPPLNLTERSTAPSSPNTGSIYLDDGSNTGTGNPGLRHYNGSTWEDIGGASAGGNATLSQLILTDGSELTIATGAITVTKARHTVDTESDAASDDLDTINGTVAGETFILSANNTGRTVVLKNGVDNIITSTGGDITLDETYKAVLCVSDGTNVNAYPVNGGEVTASSTNTFTNKTQTDIVLVSSTELTIATGAITVTQAYHTVDTEGDAGTDDLDTISGGATGEIIYLSANNDARTVVIKNGTGNILTWGSADVSLDEDHKVIQLQYNGTNWCEIGNSAGTTPDAASVTYTPTTLADWNSSTDPGNVDDALDQLADRVGTLEAASPAGTAQLMLTSAGGSAPTTNGAADGSIETATNAVLVPTKDFDASTDEFVQWAVPMPVSWDASTITATFYWSAASGSGDVVWGLQGVAFSNDDALDAAFGTAQTVTDTLTATGDLCITSATSAMTIAGTPAAGDLVVFRAYRDANNGSDTLAVDAQLIAVNITYGLA